MSCGPAAEFEAGASYPLLYLDELRSRAPLVRMFRARLDGDGLEYAEGRIDALVAAGGGVAGTRTPSATQVGVAQVRRDCVLDGLDVLHLVFTPAAMRPLLLAWVQLFNRTEHPLLVHYSELWDVTPTAVRVAEAACIGETPKGERVLADLGSAPRASAPDPPPEEGLALDARFVVPPHQLRELTFGYVATPPGDSAALLVRAWRGAVKSELERTYAAWVARLGPEPLPAYRSMLAQRVSM